MNQDELIAQIVDKAAAAVEAKLVPKEQALLEPTQKQESDEGVYNFQIRRRWRWPKTYRVRNHMFATHDWLQKPDSGDWVLVPSLDALVLTLADNSRLILPKCNAAEFRVWR